MDVAELQMRVNTRDLRRADGDLSRFRGSAERAERASVSMGAAMAKAASLAAAAFGSANIVSTLRGFESGMAKVAAISGATGSELSALRQQAKELGATTEFSASQAAGGMQFLAQAGFSATEVLQSLPTVLNLATASAVDMSTAADIASNILGGFGKEASDLAGIADVLAQTTATSNTNLVQLGQAMSYAGPLAASAGVSVEQAAAAIGKLSDAGIQGSRAGTSLSGVIRRLQNPSKTAQEAIDNLGLSLEDVDLKGESLAEVMALFAEANLDAASAAQIFEAEAAPGALVLANNAEAAAAMAKELEASDGALSGMAGTMRDTLDGSFRGLGSAIEGLVLALGDAGLTNVLRDAVDGLTDMVRAISGLDNLDKVALGVGAVAGAISLAVSPILTLAAAATTAALYIGANWESLSQRFPRVAGIMQGAASLASRAFDSVMNALPGFAASARAAFSEYYQGVSGSFEPALASIRSAWESTKGAFSNISMSIAAIVDAFGFGDTEAANMQSIARFFGQLAGLALEGAASALNLVAKGLEAATGVILGVVTGDWEGATASVRGFFDWLTSGLVLPDWLSDFSFANVFAGVDVAAAAETVRGWFPANFSEVTPDWMRDLSFASLWPSIDPQAALDWFSSLWPSFEQSLPDWARDLSFSDLFPTIDTSAVVQAFLEWFPDSLSDILPEWLTSLSFSDFFPSVDLSGAIEFFRGLFPTWEDIKPDWVDRLDFQSIFGRDDDGVSVADLAASAERVAELQTDIAATTAGLGELDVLAADTTARVVQMFASVNAELIAAASNAFTAGVQVAGDFGRGIAEGGQQAVGEAQSLGVAIVATFSGLSAQMQVAGTQAMQGLVLGIEAGRAQAVQAATDAANATLQAARDALDIRSPSRKFREVGEFVMAGLEEGIVAGTPALEQTAERMAEGLHDQVSSAFGSLADTIGQSFGGLLTGAFENFDDFLQSVGSAFKNTIAQLISTAASNPISLALGVGGTAATGAVAAQGQLGGLLSGGTGILGSLGGFVSSIGSGFGSVVSGFLTGGFGGAASAIGTALGGVSSGLAGLGTAIGAIAAPVLAITAVFSFFRKRTEELDRGLRVTVDSFDAFVETFREIETTRFWGLSRSRSTNYDTASDEVASPIQLAVNDTLTNIANMAELLNLSSANLEDFAYQFQISTDGLSDEQVAEALETEFRNMADAAVTAIVGQAEVIERELTPVFDDAYQAVEEARGADAEATAELEEQITTTTETVFTLTQQFEDMMLAGEGASDTLERLVSHVSQANLAMDTLGLSMYEMSLAGADLASQLVQAFGGDDAFGSAIEQYYAAVYTQEERLAILLRQTTEIVEDLGLSMPQTRAEYRKLVESFDLTTTRGQELFAAMVSLAGSFDQVLPSVVTFTQQIQQLMIGASSSVATMISEISSLAQEAANAATDWYRAATTLRGFLSDLVNANTTSQSLAERQVSNQQEFARLVALAEGGDVDAARSITGVAQDLLETSRESAGSIAEYRFMEASIAAQINRLAGMSELEAARLTVEESLMQQQLDVLSSLNEYLNTEGVTEDGIQEFVDQLLSLEDAIESVENLNLAFLQERLSVAVDLSAQADIPDYLRELISNAETGIQSTIDFAVSEAGLTPEMRFLAISAASEHIRTIEMIVDQQTLTDDELSLITETAGSFVQSIQLVADNLMSDQMTELALGDANDILLAVEFAVAALPADVAALLAPQIEPLRREIDFLLGDTLPDDEQFLALTPDSEFTRVVNVVAGALVTSEVSELALSSPRAFRRSLNIVARTLPTSDVRELALSTAEEFRREIELVHTNPLSPDVAALALANSSDLVRTIDALRGDLDPEAVMLALAGSSEIQRVVNVSLGADVDDDARALALIGLNTIQVNIATALERPLTEEMRTLVFENTSTFTATIEAALAQDLPDGVRAALLGDQVNLTTVVSATLNSRLPEPIQALLVSSATQAVRAITITTVFPDALSEADLALLTEVGTEAVRTLVGFSNLRAMTDKGLDLLRAKDGTVSKTLVGRDSLNRMSGLGVDLLTLRGGAVTRVMRGRSQMGQFGEQAAALLDLQDQNVSRTMRGLDDMAGLGTDAVTLLNLSDEAVNRTLAARADMTRFRTHAYTLLNLGDENVSRTMVARADMSRFRNHAYDLLSLSDNSIDRTMSGRSDMSQFEGEAIALLNLSDESVLRTMNARADMTRFRSNAYTLLNLADGDVRRTMVARADMSRFRNYAYDLLDLENQSTVSRLMAGAADLSGFSSDALTLLNLGNRSIDRIMVGSSDMTDFSAEAGILLVSNSHTVDRLLHGTSDLSGFSIDGFRLLQANDTIVDRLLRGASDLSGFNMSGFRLLQSEDGSVDRLLRGTSTLTGFSIDGFRLLQASNATIDRVLLGMDDLSGLSSEGRALLNAISGGSTGTITLAGGVTFDPTTAFADSLDDAIATPMSTLTDALTDLQQAIEAEAARQESVLQLQSLQDQLAAASTSRTASIDTAEGIMADIRALEAQTGVDLRNGASDALLTIDNLGNALYAATHLDYDPSTADLAAFQSAFYGPNGLEAQLVAASGQTSSMLQQMNALRSQIVNLGGVPAFAMGGAHMGGLRIVGERGPELELTGASRIYSAQKTRDMMSSMDNSTLRELVAKTEEQAKQLNWTNELLRKIAVSNEKTARVLRDFDETGLPGERVA